MTVATLQNDFANRLESVNAQLVQLDSEIASRNHRRDELLAMRARIETERACAAGERVLSAEEVRAKLRNMSVAGFKKLRSNPKANFPKAVYLDSDPGWIERDVDEWIREQKR